jgi:hypothetical protein
LPGVAITAAIYRKLKLELLALLTVRYFCVVQKEKGVADAMIEAPDNV